MEHEYHSGGNTLSLSGKNTSAKMFALFFRFPLLKRTCCAGKQSGSDKMSVAKYYGKKCYHVYTARLKQYNSIPKTH